MQGTTKETSLDMFKIKREVKKQYTNCSVKMAKKRWGNKVTAALLKPYFGWVFSWQEDVYFISPLGTGGRNRISAQPW